MTRKICDKFYDVRESDPVFYTLFGTEDRVSTTVTNLCGDLK